MRFGIALFPTDDGVDPASVARMVEERGFESLFFAEDTHIPASRRTRRGDGELPRQYSRIYDPFVALTAAAAATSGPRDGWRVVHPCHAQVATGGTRVEVATGGALVA